MKRLFFLILILLFSLNLPAKASAIADEFSKLLILDQGRYKPIDSYAKSKLLQFSGKTKVNGKNYREWFTELVFNPESIYSEKIFLINNPEVLTAINVEVDTHRRYSYDELRTGIDVLNDLVKSAEAKPEKERSLVEKEFVRVFNNFHEFTQLANSFSLFQRKPVLTTIASENLKSSLGLNGELSLFSLIDKASELEVLIRSSNLKEEAVKLGFVIFSWVETYKEYLNLFRLEEVFAILPNIAVTESKTNLEFYSPWTYFHEMQSQPASYKLIHLKSCLNLQNAYYDKDTKSFRAIVEKMNTASYQHISSLNKVRPKIELELLHNRLQPLERSQLLYLFSLLLLISSAFFTPKAAFRFNLEKFSYLVFLLAFLLHGSGILMRILILSRAPVSNLYETFVFVAFISALLALVISMTLKKVKNTLSETLALSEEKKSCVFLGSLSAFMLLLISSKFVTDGDSMKVLIAVLDSNFWLSTHVIAEMMGYAGVSLAGLIGHLYLIKFLRGKFRRNAVTESLKFYHKLILGMIGFGLCFTFLGTMLGGIWADQSWGRFWGWDPKENGALLIILWTAITLHSRLAGYIKDFGVAVFSIIGTMVVMISWFGVNLLGVGLHSYGFTEGLMVNLLTYLGLEFLFIIGCIVLTKYQSLKMT